MRKLIYLIGFFMVGLVTVAQDHGVKEKTEDGFENMTFQVVLDKDTYILMEPAYVKLKFSNQTQKPQTTYPPFFPSDTAIRVNSDGKVREFTFAFVSFGKPNPFFPIVYQPGAVYEEVLNLNTNGFFPVPGNYQVQFVLGGAAGAKTISSNIINVTITEPLGLDKEAYEFLKKYEKSNIFLGWIHVAPGEKSMIPTLEEFVFHYSQTPYGDLAIYHLGRKYQSKGDLDKAMAEFEKLKFSNKKYIADLADQAIKEVREMKSALEKSEQEKKPR